MTGVLVILLLCVAAAAVVEAGRRRALRDRADEVWADESLREFRALADVRVAAS